MDRKRRSLVKSITWRVVAFATTVAVAYLILGDVKASLSIGVVANGIKVGLYYMHERMWEDIHWGRPS